MKHIAGIIFTLLVLGTSAHAQVQVSCTPITDSNYTFCCSGGNANLQDCRDFKKPQSTQPSNYVQQSSGTQTTTSTPGFIYAPNTIGSGTGVINNTTPDNTIGDTPQSGSDELKQCSKIEFISLLDILIWAKCIIYVAIIPLIFGLAFLFFLWGVLKFIRASDSNKQAEAKKIIWAGLIGLFVMTSVWGIISIVSRTLGTGSTVPLLQTTYLKK